LLNLGLDIWEAISVDFLFYMSLMSFIREEGNYKYCGFWYRASGPTDAKRRAGDWRVYGPVIPYILYGVFEPVVHPHPPRPPPIRVERKEELASRTTLRAGRRGESMCV
jgi:hypothetical protein